MTTAPVQISRSMPKASISFADKLRSTGLSLSAALIDTLQVNVGKLCNQACKHCHVDASPIRTEIMERKTVDACLKVLRENDIKTLDLTGGAAEMIPDFRHFVTEAKKIGVHIIIRHNLTVMFEENQQDLPEFFAENEIEVVSSLPYFIAEKTDAQRGTGVFDKSIEALKRLNKVGYGIDENLKLNLVYNPVGAFLPPEQSAIEADFKRELKQRYDIVFNSLYAITNMPIARFLDWLRRSKNEESYMQKLVKAFNPATIEGLMCRNILSVDWLGNLYDCDFNQMLDIPVESKHTIFDFNLGTLKNRRISTENHCYGCTAGSGSSCGGVVA